MPVPTAQTIFATSDAAQTRRYLAALAACGADGALAAHLFRAAKASARAKVYRGGLTDDGPRYRDLAYHRKQQALEQLCECLTRQQELIWGWGADAEQPWYHHVLYVDTSEGQVSFHAPVRGQGPDYAGVWDGTHLSTERILALCDAVVATPPPLPLFAGSLAHV